MLDSNLKQPMDKEEYRVASISGTVCNDQGQPKGGVYVEAWNDNTGSYASDISSDGTDGRTAGTYNLAGLTPGTGYVITAWSEGNVSQADASIADITLGSNEQIAGKDITILEARTVTGVVMDGENPLEGIQVTAQSEDSGWQTLALTDAAGNFELQGLLPGSYTIATKNNKFYRDQVISNVNPDDVVDGMFIELQKGGEITGTVQDDEGNILSGVQVTATSVIARVERSVTTDENGAFSIQGLMDPNAYDYQLSFWKSGYLKATEQVAGIPEPGVIIILAEPVLLEKVTGQGFSGTGNSIKAMQEVVAPGGPLTYRIDYQNYNNQYDIQNAVLQVKLPTQTTFVGSNKGNLQNGALVIGLPEVKAGKDGTVTALVQVNQNVDVLQLIASATVEYLDENNEARTDTIGISTTNVVYASINGPALAFPGPITVYGESSKDASIEIFGIKNGGSPEKLGKTKADGKWWSATLDFSQNKLGEGTYQLYAIAAKSSASNQIKLEIKRSVPVVKETTIVEAGWNKDVRSNPWTGLPTMAVAENSPIKIQVKFDESAGQPDAGSVRLHFLDQVVTMDRKTGMRTRLEPGLNWYPMNLTEAHRRSIKQFTPMNTVTLALEAYRTETTTCWSAGTGTLAGKSWTLLSATTSR